jgi:hypothetical protein
MASWRLFGEQVRAWGCTSVLVAVRRQRGAMAWVHTGRARRPVTRAEPDTPDGHPIVSQDTPRSSSDDPPHIAAVDALV